MAATTELIRPKDDLVITGVCAGLARRFGWDPTLVRTIFVLSFFLPGPQLLIYIALWVVMPEEA